MSYYAYGSGDFEKSSNIFGMVGDREVLVPIPTGTGTITAVKAKKGYPAMIKITQSFAIPEGALKAGVLDVLPVMGMTSFFALLCKPGTLEVGDDEV